MRPDIQTFITTLKRGKGKHIPLCELGIHPIIKAMLIGRTVNELKDDVEFWYKAGYDYIKLQPKADFNPAQIGLSKNVTFNEDGTIFRKWASESKGVITSFEEFERYVFPNKEDFNYENFGKVKSLLPDGMGVIGQYGDIFTMTWEMMGFETFSISLFENPELIEALNNKVGELVLSMFENMVQQENVDVLWYSDDIAYTNGLLVSPIILDQLFFPWLKKIGDLAKQYNKPLIYHTDGILYDVFDKIIECGVDAIHPIEPKSMDILEVKKRYGDKLCVIGNVEVDLLARGTVEEIENSVKEKIKSVGQSGGYCLGSSNSIPEYVKYENYLAMLRATKEYGDL
ncbi:MAG: nucleoside 2-deoxyribosyltransferase [Ignavibacteriales bacterium]|nr:nucleoside 2-deoxyribosyltransferase [Ignavibacteriales bacterium]